MNLYILTLFFKVSRAQILKKAADYITFMRRKNHGHQQDIEDLKKHNSVLEQQSKLSYPTSTLPHVTWYSSSCGIKTNVYTQMSKQKKFWTKSSYFI